jgi:hypothetical protein
MNEFYHAGQPTQHSLFSDADYVDIQQLTLFNPAEDVVALPQTSNKTKKCCKCKEYRALDEYSQRKDGRYEARCKECIREADRLRHNTDEHNAKRRDKHAKKLAFSDKRLLNSPALPPLPILFKVCRKCDPPVEKSIDEFGISKDRKDGHNPYCKECTRRIANSEKSKERRKKYEQSLGEEFIKKRYAGSKRWREKNIEKLRIQWREKYANDPEYAARMRANTDKWAQDNPEKRNASQMKRKAAFQGAYVEDVDYQAILELHGPWCYICDGPILAHHKIEFDHVVPLIPRPGDPQGSHTADNIRPTHKECNARKSNKRLEDMLSFDRRGPDN